MKLNIYTAAVILIIVFGVLSGIQTFVLNPIDVSGAPPEIQYLYRGIVYIFSASAIAPLFVMIRNLLGYIENYFDTDPAKRGQLQFEASQFMSTWTKYEAYINGWAIFIVAFTSGTPLAPYAFYIAGTASFVTDLIRKAFKDAGAQQTPTPPTPPPS
jgi:hypothetical protein